MSLGQRWAVRVDSSVRLGAGHLMRCLTLAQQVRRRGATVEFICADFSDHMGALVQQQGFELHMLEVSRGTGGAQLFDWSMDASCTSDIAGGQPWDWLVVDHYRIDARWEAALRLQARHILVIDDLADRPHVCDVVLDQNYYPHQEHRYDELVPPHCRKLLGPRFVLLRREFTEARARLSRHIGDVRRILVNFGGADEPNITALALTAIRLIGRKDITIEVMISAATTHRADIEAQVSSLPTARLHLQTSRMAELIVEADLAIGACGSSTWERCCLGLPTLALVLADNQRNGAAALDKAGIIVNLGEACNMTAETLAREIDALIADKPGRAALSKYSLDLGIGTGPDTIDLLMDPNPR